MRNQTIDIIKGIAIYLVVFGHSIQNFTVNFYDNVVFQFIYSFHMPLFMLISGYLFAFSFKKKMPKEIIITKIKTLLLPISTYAFITLIRKDISHEFELNLTGQVYGFIWSFFHSLWFLWAVLYASIIVVLVKSFFNDRILVYIVVLLLTFFVPNVLQIHWWNYLLPFYIIGYLSNDYNVVDKVKNGLSLIFGISLVIYIVLFQFFSKDSYIYTSGFCIISKNFPDQVIKMLG